MLSDAGIAFFAGAGAGVWVYVKLARRQAGGEIIRTVIPALVVGFIVFLIFNTIISAVF